jgi:hypothetical protein
MVGRELVINFSFDKVYLTETKSVSLDTTNIGGHYRKFPRASWKVRITRYTAHLKQIHVDVLVYNPFPVEFPDYQFSENAELHEVEAIHFKSIDTSGLLSSYNPRRNATPYFPQAESAPVRREERKSTPPSTQQQTSEIDLILEIPIEEIHFKAGAVTCNQYIVQLARNVEFEVENSELKEEFDSVKEYFANVLKKKKLEFRVSISIHNGEINRIAATSPDIARIDKRIIEQSRFELARGILCNSDNLSDEQLVFTLDELIEATINKNAKASYEGSDEQFFADVLSIADTKHYRQLRYLSDKHLFRLVKLRFVVKPFSFVFLVEGVDAYYFVWETLNTAEATYVWQVVKDKLVLKEAEDKIQKAISSIKVTGKEQYISKAGSDFTRVRHDYSDEIAGFSTWSNSLERVIY